MDKVVERWGFRVGQPNGTRDASAIDPVVEVASSRKIGRMTTLTKMLALILYVAIIYFVATTVRAAGADPANSIFFGEDDLKGISIPVQLWASERGGAGVSVQSVGNVLQRLPAGTEYHVVPDAGHFSFLAPGTAG